MENASIPEGCQHVITKYIGEITQVSLCRSAVTLSEVSATFRCVTLEMNCFVHIIFQVVVYGEQCENLSSSNDGNKEPHESAYIMRRTNKFCVVFTHCTYVFLSNTFLCPSLLTLHVLFSLYIFISIITGSIFLHFIFGLQSLVQCHDDLYLCYLTRSLKIIVKLIISYYDYFRAILRKCNGPKLSFFIFEGTHYTFLAFPRSASQIKLVLSSLAATLPCVPSIVHYILIIPSPFRLRATCVALRVYNGCSFYTTEPSS